MSEKETEIKKNDVDNKEKKGKKSDKAIVVGLVIALLGGVAYGGYKAYEYFKPFNIEDRIASLKKDAGDDGRVIDHIDEDRIKEIFDKVEKKGTSEYDMAQNELKNNPYKNSVVDGMNIYEAGTSGKESFSELYKNGSFEYWFTGLSLRHPDDEKVDPNQTDSFNSFSSAIFALDREDNKKLSDKEVQTWAENAEAMALKQHSPAYFYIKDLILNLKGKNPTTASVYYLMIANRIKPDMLTEDLSYNITDNTKYLDTSHKDEKKKKSIVYSWDTDIEFLNKQNAVIHELVDGSLTHYAIVDKVNARGSRYRANNAKDHFVTVIHYKDISNKMLAEYAITSGNNDAQASNISTGLYSVYKPAFTWNISPKIEKICTQYYDIVEPMVYNGTFTSRKDVINQMVKKYKYSFDEIMSAVLTYEYWALG
ncbi:hypothetical protein [[Clostridium] innocuum]|uniref:hypothetical protein n=1 Tax=Clostridium innocuum TaxID=1522 RepID=UPI000D6CED1D|nr:hypothetical protein [[Clostridium] innocuum]MCR0369669.1 hypothetical protein [[Clostridium] innocuum]PWJ12752.1 hypothetical protein ATF84_1132 [[Clostridium] innocuum]SSA47118.1 hypothetical protein SAMN04487929_1132 [[Clostridium] innocuum]